MSKDTVSAWDTTPANNTDVGGVDLAENSMRPRDVNNAIRTMMAQIATGIDGGEFGPTDAEIREKLTAARTYYVRADGSDSNNGLANTSGGAFLTIQKAVNTTAALDIGIYNVTIQVGSGTYSGNATVTGPWVGSGAVTIVGDTSTPTNCVWNVTSGACLQALSAARVSVGGFHFNANGVGSIAVSATQYAVITISGACQFGAVSAAHVYMFDGGIVLFSANSTISGDAPYFVIAESMTFMRWQSVTCTASGTRTFTSFVRASAGAIISTGVTFSGTFVGKRYEAVLNGVINTFGSGASYFPGNAAGTTATGGQYV